MKYLLTIILIMSVNVFAKQDELDMSPLEESLILKNTFIGDLDKDKLVICYGVRGEALDCANWILNNYSFSVKHIDDNTRIIEIYLIRD